jgi:hypothetical protein
MGNFIFGAVTATVLSYAYVMFGWSLPAVVELPNMIGALPEKIALIELVDDPALTDEQRQRAVALRIRSEPAIFLAYEKATNGAFTKHVLREQGCNRVWKIIVQAKSIRATIERLKRGGDVDRRRLLERYDPDGKYLAVVRSAIGSDQSVRAYIAQRFGTIDPAKAAAAIASAPVEYCGVDVLVRGEKAS